MLSDSTIKKIFPYLVFLLFVANVVGAMTFLGRITITYRYVVYALIDWCCLSYYCRHYKKLQSNYPFLCMFFNVLLLYVVYSIIKIVLGIPSSIFPWIRFGITSSCIFFSSIFIFGEEEIRTSVFKLCWKMLPVILFLSLLFCANELVYSMSFVLLSMVFYDFLPKFKKRVCWIVLILVVTLSMYQRMDFITVCLPLCIVFVYRLLRLTKVRSLRTTITLVFVLPFVLFLLAYSGVFNIFNMESYMSDREIGKAGTLTTDTRTFLYEESIQSAYDNNYVLFGRGIGYGYDSRFVAERDGSFYYVRGLVPQRLSEVGVVNIFTMLGLVGLVLFVLFYRKYSFLGLISNNDLVKCLSLWVALYWMFSWMSHTLYLPSSEYASLFIVLSLICDEKIRKMSERQITNYIKELFK